MRRLHGEFVPWAAMVVERPTAPHPLNQGKAAQQVWIRGAAAGVAHCSSEVRPSRIAYFVRSATV